MCSKGGGGLLRERMEVVSELWDADVKVNEFLEVAANSMQLYIKCSCSYNVLLCRRISCIRHLLVRLNNMIMQMSVGSSG